MWKNNVGWRGRPLVLATVALAFVAVSCNGAPHSESDEDRFLSNHDFLRGNHTLTSFQEWLREFQQSPDYYTLTAHQELLRAILDEGPAEVHLYQWKNGEHDLGRIAGRAAWALEKWLGIDLPKVEPVSSRKDLEKIHAKAAEAVSRHRRSVIGNHPISREPSVADLRAKYRAKIVPGQSRELVHPSVQPMEELLREWFPIGKKLADLEGIIGVPAEKFPPHRALLNFDAHVGGRSYWFYCEADEIIHVNYGIQR